MGYRFAVEKAGYSEGRGGFGEGGDIEDSCATSDLASGCGRGYSMDVKTVEQTDEAGV